ncbi:MAG: hypothetical protein AB7O98_19355 [Hyphomonadaceae bacterium]
MKVWILAGLFTVATVPFAAAAEVTAECQLDESRRATQERSDVAPAAPALPSVARPVVAQRDAVTETAARAGGERRRSGKRIPDAELIGPRGAL